MPLCRVPKKKTLGKDAFCRVLKNGSRQNTSLPSARKKALDKDVFCRVSKNSTRQNTYLPSARKRHSAKTYFVECFFCRVYFIWHSAKTVFAECPIKYTRQSLRHSAKCRFPVVTYCCETYLEIKPYRFMYELNLHFFMKIQ